MNSGKKIVEHKKKTFRLSTRKPEGIKKGERGMKEDKNFSITISWNDPKNTPYLFFENP